MKSAWAVLAAHLALLIPEIVFGTNNSNPFSDENKSASCWDINFRLKALFTPVLVSILVNQFDNARPACDGSIHKLQFNKTRVYAELLYRSLSGLSPSMFSSNKSFLPESDDNTHVIRLERQNLRLLNDTGTASLTTLFPCRALSQPGFYAIRVTDQQNRTLHTKLSWKRLINADRPRDSSTTALIPLTLWLRNDSIFPSCKDDFTVSWQLPETCNINELSASLDFRVRAFASATSGDARRSTGAKNLFQSIAYAMKTHRGKRAAGDVFNDADTTSEWIYMGELAAKWTDSRHALISIPCVQFDIVYEAFCFELVSIDRRFNHVELWDRKCVSTEPRTYLPREKLGNWSEWSVWSHCQPCRSRPKRSCCNSSDSGYRKRRRHCLTDSAVSQQQPTNGCASGKLTDVECCRLSQHAVVDDLRSTALAAIGTHLPLGLSDCNCGCNLTQMFGNSSSGTFFVVNSPECERHAFYTWNLDPIVGDNIERQLTAQIRPIKMALNTVNLRVIAESDQTRRLLWTSETLSVDENEYTRNGKQLNARLAADERLIFNLSLVMIDSKSYLASNKDNDGFYIDFLLKKDDSMRQSFGSGDESSMLSILRFPLNILLSTFAGCDFKKEANKSCERWVTILSASCAVLLLIIVLMLPPIICAFLSRRFTSIRYSKACLPATRKRLRSDAHATREFLIPKHDRQLVRFRSSEMIHSGDTNSTQTTVCATSTPLTENITFLQDNSDLNPNRPVTKRSIGIQLSRQSTPRLTSRHDLNNNSHNNYNNNNTKDFRVKAYGCVDEESRSPENTTILDELADGGTESGTDGLEYDYYEPPPLPSSFLADARHRSGTILGTALGDDFCELISEIDIDEIVREEAPSITGVWRTNAASCWSRKVRVLTTQDAHTQISGSL